MIAVAHEGARWTAIELGHLASCADCRAEWALVSTASAMARSLAPADPLRMTRAIHERFATDPDARPSAVSAANWPRRDWRAWGIGLAAAAVLLAGIGLEQVEQRRQVGPPVSGSLVSEVDDLTAPELERVLDAIVSPLEPAMPSGAVGMSDLTASELEWVLDYWEG